MAKKTISSRRRLKHRPPPLSSEELVELRAAHRTFEGAYIRTALSQLGFALVVLKIFSREFYPIGALFAFFGAGILLISFWRRKMAITLEDKENKDGGGFKTVGSIVLLISTLSVAAYVVLLVLLLRIDQN